MARFDEWARRVLEKEEAIRAESDSAPPLSGVADFIWWLEVEEMLNELGITQVAVESSESGASDDN